MRPGLNTGICRWGKKEIFIMTNEQMRAAAQHIKYELDAFVHAFHAMLAHRTKPPLDSLLV